MLFRSILIACVGGGSNSIGLFHEFMDDEVRMIGVEAGGFGNKLGEHAARFMNDASVGVLQGTKSYLLQDANGQIALTHSVSAGLDYASIGPEHELDADQECLATMNCKVNELSRRAASSLIDHLLATASPVVPMRRAG